MLENFVTEFYDFCIMTNEEMMQYVVKSIKTIRKEKKLSQTDLCLKANMSQGFLTDIETGKKEPSTMTLIRIANALQVNPSAFFPQTDENCEPMRNKIKDEIYALLKILWNGG